jgi:hypothetical protein
LADNNQLFEIQYKYLQDFLNLWEEYYKQLNEGLLATEATEDMENRFLQLRMRITTLTQILKEILGSEVDFDGNVNKVLQDSVSFDILRAESPIKINFMRSVWHDATIQSRKLQAVLRSRLTPT